MDDGQYAEMMQGIGQALAAIARAWPAAGGPERVRLLDANNLLERARAKLIKARAAGLKEPPPAQPGEGTV